MDNDAAGPKAGLIRGFVDGAVSIRASATLVIAGPMGGFSGLTAWLPVYVGATAGSRTQTRPIAALGGSQVMIAELGFALSSTSVFVRPLPIEYKLRDVMAQNDVLSIAHHADAAAYKRLVKAYTLGDAGRVLDYASANQDSDVALADAIPSYGSDQCTGGTASNSSTFANPSLNADKAFDDNNATMWVSNSVAAPHWVEYQFTSSKTIRRYTIRAEATTPNRSPGTFRSEYWDGSAFQTADSRTGQTGWTSGQQRTFDVAASHSSTRWRILIVTTAGATPASIAEMEMMEISGFSGQRLKLAQTFTLAGTEAIASVGLWLKKVGSPTGTATVRIETLDGSDNPTGTLAHANATGSFSESALGTSYSELLVAFNGDFNLPAGEYVIVLSTDRSASNTDYVHWGADASAPAFAGGEMKSYNGGVWAAESKDAVFALYDLGNPSGVRVGWWNSAFADLVSRYGDGNGMNLETETTFKCLRVAGFDDITLCVRVE